MSSAQEGNQNGTPDFEGKKQIKVSSIITKEDFISSLKNRYSCWLKLKYLIVFLLRWKANHHRKQSMLTEENKKVTINFTNENPHILDISRIQQVERCIIKLFQSKKTEYEEARIRRGRNKEDQPDLQFRSLFRHGLLKIRPYM